MASEVTIQYAEKIADLTLNGTVKKGDMLAHNGTGWVQAAATDAATNLYAQYLAMAGGVSGNVIKGCKGCVLYDADAPYTTANATEYLSGTAGAITQVRPATNGDVVQKVGRSISTTEARIDILAPYEMEIFIPCPPYNTLSGGISEAHAPDGTTNEWAGADVDSAAVGAIFQGWFPSNMVGAPLAADLIVNTQASTALDIDVTFVRAYINDSNTGDAGSSLVGNTTTSETTADNEIQKVSVLTGMDADFVKAGAPFGVAVDADAGDFLLIGLYMRYLLV